MRARSDGLCAVAEPQVEREVSRCYDGVASRTVDLVAEEVPVALVYNGISHAVMLATPADLEDFAVGFSLSEGIIGSVGEIFDIDIRAHEAGIEVDIHLAGASDHALRVRRRALAGRTGCGLCGIESLDQAVVAPRPVKSAYGRMADGALARAVAGLEGRQRLFELTGAVHAAAWCTWTGAIRMLREDVGRHNALDKVIGALAREQVSLDEGFALITSRASYEMVGKAAAAGIGVLAAVSAPTGLAVRAAEAAGITLIGFLRGRGHSVYCCPQGFAAVAVLGEAA